MPRARSAPSATVVASDAVPAAADLSPVLDPDPLDLRVSLSSIVHWADSHQLRVQLMRSVDFPVDDLPMFLIVNQLSYRGAMRPTDLAGVLGTGKANLSKIANRLDEAGLIVRVPASDDERSTLLALTPAGREIGRRIMRLAQESLDTVLADWSPSDVVTLRRLVSRLARSTTGAPPSPERFPSQQRGVVAESGPEKADHA